MPSFDQVIEDVSALVGIKLRSIRPGAEITLSEIDFDERRIILTTSKGVKKSRSFSEVEMIVNALNTNGIAHVDTVLAGSGSSRNQPETILANLSYIEYTFIDRKKHLILRDEPTHALGEIKELDLLEAKRIVDQYKGRQRSLPSQIIVTSNVRDTTMALVSLGGELEALNPSVYSVHIQGRFIWVVSHGTLKCTSDGAYSLLSVAPTHNAFSIGTLLGNRLFEEPGSFTITSLIE